MIVLSLFVNIDKIDATKSSFCRFLSKLTKNCCTVVKDKKLAPFFFLSFLSPTFPVHTRASVDEVHELLEVLAVEEVSDGRERTGMGHVKPWTVQLPDVTRLGRCGEHALVHESQEDLMLLVVPVVVRRLPQVGKELT